MAARKKGLILRIPEDLHKHLVREAKKAKRSLNEEMVQRLRWSLGLSAGELGVLQILAAIDTRHAQVQKVLAHAKDVYAQAIELIQKHKTPGLAEFLLEKEKIK
jgi:hypothetical protein